MALSKTQIRILALVMGLVFLVIDLNVPLGVAAGIPYVVVVLLGLWLPRRRETVFTAILCSVATLVGYLLSREGGFEWMVATNRLLALLAIWACAVTVLLRKNTLQQLGQAKRRTDDLLEISQAIIVELNNDFRIVEINDRGCDVLGIEREKLIGQIWSEVSMPENMRNRAVRDWGRVISGARSLPDENESSVCTPSGEMRHIAWHNRAIRDKSGNMSGSLSSGQDITARKEAEADLKRTLDGLEHKIEERAREFRLIIDQLPVQISRFDTHENYVLVNRTSADWLNSDYDSSKPLPIKEVTGPDIYEKLRDRIARSIAGEPQDFEISLVYPDGKLRDVRIQYLPDKNKSGEVISVIGLVIDLTQDKRAALALALSEDRYRTIFDAGNVAIIRTDMRTGQVVDANNREAQLLGYANRGDLLANYSADKHWHSPEERKKWIARAIENVQLLDEELRLIDLNGKDIWLHTCSVIDPEENFIDIISVDITKVKEQERVVMAAREEAELANRAKSEFLANMSHELRTPLNAILGFAQIIRDQLFGPNDNSRYVEYAGDVYSSGEHLLAIINDVLDLSRVEAGKANMYLTVIDVDAIVDSCLKLVNGRILEAGQTISKNIALPEKHLYGDERMIKQMLLNLLSNANKFTPESGLISIETRETEDDHFEFSVTDDGIGIDEADLPHVMEPFGQVEGAFTRQFDGTGLGLPLVASLAELHKGGLRVESLPGEGTTVTIRLPLSDGATDEAG